MKKVPQKNELHSGGNNDPPRKRVNEVLMHKRSMNPKERNISDHEASMRTQHAKEHMRSSSKSERKAPRSYEKGELVTDDPGTFGVLSGKSYDRVRRRQSPNK